MSTPAAQTTLGRLFGLLVRKARRSGQVERMDLKGGARLIVVAGEEVVTLTIARKGNPVGDRELITFRSQLAIPEHARRWPATGQTTKTDDDDATWHVVVYQWGIE